MAEAPEPITTTWGPAYLKTYYDADTLRVTRFVYANASIRPAPRGDAYIEVYKRTGNNNTPVLTQKISPGTPDQEVSAATMNIGLDPTTGEFDKWSIQTRGPGS